MADCAAPRPLFLRRIAARFSGLPTHKKLLIVEAVTWLALVRIALLAEPFRHFVDRLGTVATSNNVPNRPDLSVAQGATVREVAWLDADAIEVTGYPLDEGFVEVVRFL